MGASPFLLAVISDEIFMGTLEKNQTLIRFASLLVLFLLIFSAYSNTFYSPPVLDDIHSFVEEPKLQIESFSLQNLKTLTQTSFGYNRLLPILTFAWDFFWGKGHISAFHVTNLLIHYLSFGAVFFFLLSLFRCVYFRFPNEFSDSFPKFWIALLIVGIWALNPVQTNAVTYMVQRMTSMAAMFYLLSVSCYLRARLLQQRNEKKLQICSYYLLSIITALGAFLSKQNSAMLPVVIIIAEIMFFTPDLFQKVLKRKLLFIAIIFIVFLSLAFVFKNIPDYIFELYDRRQFSLGQRLLTEMRVVSSYIFLLLLPLPRFLNLEHDVSLSTSLISPMSTLYSSLFLIVLLFYAWKMRRRQPLITFGIIWFFANLIIESTVIPLELKFEHRLYLPSVGFYLALVFTVIAFGKLLLRKHEKKMSLALAFSLSMILLSGLSYMTYMRNSCWVDAITLYSDCVKKAPNKARNHSNLSRAYAAVGKNDLAIDEAELALTLGRKGREEYWVSASNIISAYVSKGEIKHAIARGETLLQDAPRQTKQNSYPVFLHNLGNAYVQLAQYRLAYNVFIKAYDFMSRCDRLPYFPVIENDIVNLLHKIMKCQNELAGELGLEAGKISSIYAQMAQLTYGVRKYDRALHYCKLGLTNAPDSVRCLSLQKNIEKTTHANQLQRIKGTIKSKYFLHPLRSKFNLYMAIAYIIEKLKLPATDVLNYCLSQAILMAPSSPDVTLLKSWHYYSLKDYGRALKVIDKGLLLDPKFAQLWVNKGIYALADGQRQSAISAFNNALALYPDYPYRDKVMALISSAKNFDGECSYISATQQQKEVYND